MFQVKNCNNGNMYRRRLLPTSVDDDWMQSDDDSVDEFQWKKFSEVMKNEYV